MQSAVSVFLVAVLLVTLAHQSGSNLQQGDSEAASRAELTLKGLFNYYWKNDPSNKKIEFTAKTEVLEMSFTAYFWAKCSHYQWHFLYLDFSVLKGRVTISF